MAPASPCRTSQATRSGWRSSVLPMARSRRALRMSLAEDCSPRQSVVWLAVARATALLAASGGAGVPPLTMSSSPPVLISRDRQPAQAAPASSSGGAAPASSEDHGLAALEARIAGADAALRRGGPALVVGQHGGQRIALGGAHAVEAGERAVAEPQVAQHPRHARHGREQGRVGGLAARGEALAQRQEIEQQLDEGGGVAARVSAVGQDLALELGREQLLRLRQLAGRGRRCTGRRGRGRSGRRGADSRRGHCARMPRDR